MSERKERGKREGKREGERKRMGKEIMGKREKSIK
jgi:hypothetical protein